METNMSNIGSENISRSIGLIGQFSYRTVFRFRKIPLESKKTPIIFWSLYGVLKIALAVFSLSHLYKQIINYVFSTMNTGFYTFFHSFYVWIY